MMTCKFGAVHCTVYREYFLRFQLYLCPVYSYLIIYIISAEVTVKLSIHKYVIEMTIKLFDAYVLLFQACKVE